MDPEVRTQNFEERLLSDHEDKAHVWKSYIYFFSQHWKSEHEGGVSTKCRGEECEP